MNDLRALLQFSFVHSSFSPASSHNGSLRSLYIQREPLFFFFRSFTRNIFHKYFEPFSFTIFSAARLLRNSKHFTIHYSAFRFATPPIKSHPSASPHLHFPRHCPGLHTRTAPASYHILSLSLSLRSSSRRGVQIQRCTRLCIDERFFSYLRCAFTLL